MNDSSQDTISDTDSAAPPVDSQPVDQPVTGDTSTGPAQADSQASAATESLPSNTSSAPTKEDLLAKVGSNLTPAAQPTPTQSVPDWAAEAQKHGIKSVDDLRLLKQRESLYGRQAQELGTLRQQLAQLTQSQQQADEQRRREAEKANLSPFHSKHPSHGQNLQRIQAFNGYRSALQAATPELQNDPGYRQRLAQSMGVTAQDEQLARDHQNYSAEIQRELQSDPEGFIERRAERLVNERLQQFEGYLNSRNVVNQVVTQNQDLIQKHAERMNWMLDPSVPGRDKAIWAAQQEAKVQELLSKVGKESTEAETLRARDNLARRQIAPTRNTPPTAPNPFAEYEKTKHKDPLAQERLKDSIFGKVD